MKKLTKLMATAVVLPAMIPATNVNAQSVTVNEIVGSNRYDTAALIAGSSNYKSAIIVNTDETLVDGLSAASLAGATSSPILLTKKNSIPVATKMALMGVEKIYIIGNENAVSNKVKNELSTFASVERIGGKDRIQTSIAVAKKVKSITKSNSQMYFVNGFKGEADAMSIAPVAAKNKAPIVLTNGKSLPAGVEKASNNFVIGSYAIMSDSLKNAANATRIGGVNRYETNKKVIEKFFSGYKEFYLAKGDLLVDALTVSAKEKPVVLVSEKSDKSVLKGATILTAVGGLSDKIIKDAYAAAKGEEVDEKPSNPEEKPEEKPSEHTHKWVYHKAETKEVLVSPEWYEERPIYSKEMHIICQGCGRDFGEYSRTNENKWGDHIFDECPGTGTGSGYWLEKIKIGTETIKHEAVYKTVTVKPAYYSCSECGQIKY